MLRFQIDPARAFGGASNDDPKGTLSRVRVCLVYFVR